MQRSALLKAGRKTALLAFALSCLSMNFTQTARAAEAGVLLEPAPDFDQSHAFKALLKAKPGTKIYEMRRIEYLLERLAESSCIFIRNGERHTGKTSAAHMRWKYGRFRKEIKTAEDFVKKIANGSRMTHEIYTTKTSNSKIWHTQDILMNELRQLDSALESHPRA